MFIDLLHRFDYVGKFILLRIHLTLLYERKCLANYDFFVYTLVLYMTVGLKSNGQMLTTVTTLQPLDRFSCLWLIKHPRGQVLSRLIELNPTDVSPALNHEQL